MPYETEFQAAQDLDVSVKTLRIWRQRGEGPPFYKFGRSVRYDRDERIAWAEAQRRLSTSDQGGADERAA